MESSAGKGKQHAVSSSAAERARIEEVLGKLDITDEEATPLVLDDRDDEPKERWMLAGKVLHRSVFHIQTISSALRPA